MNRRIPRTTGTNQLSLNLRVTRSPGFSGLSVLLWPLTGLAGWMITGGLFLLTGCLEVASGMAQWGGPVLAGLGGLCKGNGLVTEAAGTSFGGAIGLWVTAACGPDGAGTACLGAVLDTTELVEYVTSLLSGPLTVTSKEAGLLCGGMISDYASGLGCGGDRVLSATMLLCELSDDLQLLIR